MSLIGRSIQNNHRKPSKGPRGFAALDRAARQEISSRGGRAAHASGRAHEITPAEAREAGRRRHELEQGRRTRAEGVPV